MGMKTLIGILVALFIILHVSADTDFEPSIHFVTFKAGVSTFLLQSKQVTKIVNSSENLLGITHDSIRDKIYWSNLDNQISRANRDGTELETVLDTSTYGAFLGLAFDWIGGNIYVSTWGDHILVCSPSITPPISCYPLLSGQGAFQGITVNPVEGMMYWTSQSPGSIQKAGMDGSSPVTIVTGLNLPRGLAIDFAARRLYWADMNDNRIQTSDLDGRGFRTVVQLPGDRYPWGIAVSKDRIYFGNNDSDGNNRLQSCTKDGQDIETLYTQDTHIRHMVLLPAVDRPTNRKNHCEGQNCSMLCVLSQTSYRCLA